MLGVERKRADNQNRTVHTTFFPAKCLALGYLESICSQKNCRNIQGKKKTKTLFDRSHLANPTGRKRTSSGLAEGPQEKERKNEQQLPGSAQEASQGRRQALGSQLLLQQTRQPTPARPGCPQGHAEHTPAFWTWRSGRPVVTTSHRQELPARHFCPASSGAHTRERGVVSIWGSGPPLE